MTNNFKIIAIEALKNCDTDFSKVLKKNKLYYFYSNYIIERKGKHEIITIEDSYPATLFNIKGLKNDININIGAIVGKNGSGKSSIIELLFRAINNIACHFLFEKKNAKKTITANLRFVEGVFISFYYVSDWFYKVKVENEIFTVYRFKDDLTLDENCIYHNFCLNDLFYTEAINYSHYAYNSKEFSFYDGEKYIDWLKELFHKNDSYQTPLVLNPMRTDGNFDINRENELVKQRLLANLLRPANNGSLNFRKLGDNLTAKKIKLKLKDKKETFSYWQSIKNAEPKEKIIKLDKYTITERRNIISQLMSEVVDVKDYDTSILDTEVYSHAEMYIIFKLTSICKKYIDYHKFFNQKLNKINEKRFGLLLEKIKTDSSHITFKLKQTLNYLKFDFIKYKNNNTKSLDSLSNSISAIRKKNNIPIFELLPPPIFDVDIILASESRKDAVSFLSLSSGEKQLIYLTNSLLYHLNNIDSVTGEKLIYKNINIILEEIELYFHPDFQKSFVKYFLDSIERLELKNIQSINICFVTHSPFILSDIPSSNIMFLTVEDGSTEQKKEMRKTFGANIHELLTDNFFLSGGFIGSFSESKIEYVIEWLNKQFIEKYDPTKQQFHPNEKELKYIKQMILILDEPILKMKLSERLAELTNEESFYIDAINGHIKYLENLKSKAIKKSDYNKKEKST